MIKKIIKKITPRWVIGFYHWALAQLGALVYGYPSRKLIVIGITGTKGKSTTSYLVAKLLEANGDVVGLTSTIIFKIAQKEWLNNKKMTMLGRFGLHKLLRQMVKAGCKYAVIETSSEGIAQFRHIGIDYDIALFTNLTPEHIESHGSYNKYRDAKGKLFKELSCGRNKGVDKTAIINLDDKEADYFLKFGNKAIGITLKNASREKLKRTISVKNIKVAEDGSEFVIDGVGFSTKLLGGFNVYNLVSAISVCNVLGVSNDKLKNYIKKIKSVPGRMEFVDEGQDYKVIVDYAHEPASMKALYGIVREIPHKRVIHIFGAPGGGRDKSRRPIMGELADRYADVVVLTNDDPYLEDQKKIIEDIKKGIKKKREGEELFVIVDREDAIKLGIGMAHTDDIVLITGKGSEQVIAIGDKKLPWDDRLIAQSAIRNSKF